MLTALLLSLAPSHADDALREYANRRLVCWAETRYHATTTIYDDGTINTYGGDYRVWGVKDGRGHALDTPTFARMVGDEDYLEELQTRVDRARASYRTLTLAGLGVAALGGAGMVAGRVTESFAMSYGSGVVLAGGMALGGYSLAMGASARAPLVDVTQAYEFGLAGQRCEEYNSALRAELGLTPEDTRLLDTASVDLPERRRSFAIRPVPAPHGLVLVGTF